MADKWQELEEEVKLLKNEIKQVLVDIKDRLDGQGPFPIIQPAPSKGAAQSPAERVIEKIEVKELKDLPALFSSSSPGGGNGKAGNGNGKMANDAPAAISNTGNSHSPAASKPAGNNYALTGLPSTDLLTVATLSQWLTSGVKKVGRQRMEVMVDIYSKLGGFPTELTDVLMKLLNTDEGDGIAMKEEVSLLVEVDNLVNRNLVNPSEAAVLSLFLNGKNGKEVCHR